MTRVVATTDPGSQGFWTDVLAGGLPLHRCRHCSRTFVLPLPSCPYCATEDPEVVQSAGCGRIYSWVVIHHAFDAAFGADVPYVVVAVELDEGARVYGRLEGVAVDDIAPGLQVERAPTADDGPPLVFHPAGGGRP